MCETLFGNNWVQEYYCDNGKVVDADVQCASGLVCGNGACVVPAPTPVPTGSLFGYIYSSNGGTISGASVSTPVGPAVCSTVSASDGSYTCANLPVGSYWIAADKTHFSPNWNSNVAVTAGQSKRSDITLTAPTCSESDGGNAPNTAGTITGVDINNNWQSFGDTCGASGVWEGYCSANKVMVALVSCANGCKDGACTAAPTPTPLPSCSVAKACPCSGCTSYCTQGGRWWIGTETGGTCTKDYNKCVFSNGWTYEVEHYCADGGILKETWTHNEHCWCYEGVCD